MHFFLFVNSYLYYAIPGKNQGLFRVDLASLPASSTFQPSQIIGYDDLWTFVVDFQNAQLYTPNASSDTVMSSFLDGSDIKNFREKVVKREFQNMRSMMYYDRAFFWTNGTIVWFEEFDPGFTQYRHNMMLFFFKSYCGLNLLHPKAQPTPGKFHWYLSKCIYMHFCFLLFPPSNRNKETQDFKHIYIHTHWT